MKLYERVPDHVIMVIINKKNRQSEHFSVIDTTMEEVIDWVRKVISRERVSPFYDGYVTSVVVRDREGGKNGKAKSISFRGICPADCKRILLNSL